MLMLTVNYLQVTACDYDAVKRHKIYRKNHESSKGKPMHNYVPINYHKPPKNTNSTSTDAIPGGAWCNKMVAKHEDEHSTAPADK